MISQKEVQELVHRLEEGSWVKWVQLTTLVVVCVAVFIAFVFDPFYWGLFKGLSNGKGMEQAQIAREIARGNGFSTKMIRPLVIDQFKQSKGYIPVDKLPDTYHAPLWPVVLSPFIWILRDHPQMGPVVQWQFMSVPVGHWLFGWTIEDHWKLTIRDFVYSPDRMVAAVACVFFLLSAVVNYFSLRRLFDHRLAIYTTGLVLIGEVFWRYALSGLPQMLMIFLFSLACYTLIRAVENRVADHPPLPWLLATAGIFGALALTHAVTIWMFAGVLFFGVFYFKPRVETLGMMVGVFLVVYVPWLFRNYQVSGSMLGVSAYSLLVGLKGSEAMIMRGIAFVADTVTPLYFRGKVMTGFSNQFGDMINLLGRNPMAPIFFLALLHRFKKPEASAIRWLLLSVWFFSALGMSLYNAEDESSVCHANDLYPLLIPMFAAYGFAFFLVLWSRLEITVPLVNTFVKVVVYMVGALPLVNTFLTSRTGVVQWPPYVPPYISILGTWTTDKEIIASDMPWGVAWYADRRSLWLPATLQDFIDLNDYDRLGGRIVGLYLTPITGNRALVADIVKGEYREWAPFILRSVNAKDFPLRAATALPVDSQCIFYADHDRWTDRTD